MTCLKARGIFADGSNGWTVHYHQSLRGFGERFRRVACLPVCGVLTHAITVVRGNQLIDAQPC